MRTDSIVTNNFCLQITVSDDGSLNVTVKNESVTPNFILHFVPNYATIAFPYDIGVAVQVFAGYLNFHVQLSPLYMGTTVGLLGNYNGNASDDFVFRNGAVLDVAASDREIHQFSQSCKSVLYHEK